MLNSRDKFKLLRAIFKTKFWKVNPKINLFLYKYLKKFKIRKVENKYIIHSHLPPINSLAYQRFVSEFLIKKSTAPSHAQIGITNSCPMKCDFCYNQDRKGKLISTEQILETINELKGMGVIWLGLTGGEPLMNPDLVEIVASIGDSVCSKLFTTGFGLTNELTRDLKSAGLDYVSISLDDWREDKYDQIRNFQGAYKVALKAIELLKKNNIHVSVSAVFPRYMIENNKLEKFINFLIEQEVDEAWLSEVKPSCRKYWNSKHVITEKERQLLVDIQDEYNKKDDITINYLGHFEGKEHFGCAAGNRMIYIDSYGEMSPCVFTPISFGNIKDFPLSVLFAEMSSNFSTEDKCFINKNYMNLEKFCKDDLPLSREDTLKMMEEVEFNNLSEFFKLFKGEDK